MLSASKRARCSPRRSISGAIELRRSEVSWNCRSRRTMAERSPRCRSSRPASSARVAAYSSPMVAAWPSSFSNSCRSASRAASDLDHGGALPTMPFLQAGQFGARGGVFFADGGRLAFEFLQLLPLGFQGRFASGAQAVLFFDRPAILLALFGRFFRIAPQPLQLQARYRKPRIGPREVVRQLAHVVLQGHAVFQIGRAH